MWNLALFNNDQWQTITNLGEAGLILPVFAITVAGFVYSRQRLALSVWLCALAFAIGLTLLSKVLFMAWGIGISELSFTGISGHTLLASAVLPIFVSWAVARPGNHCFSVPGLLLGGLLSFCVGVSRVALGAHSESEVVAGWLLGGLVCGLTIHAMRPMPSRPRFAAFSLLSLGLALSTSTSAYLPTHQWELSLAQRIALQAEFLRQSD